VLHLVLVLAWTALLFLAAWGWVRHFRMWDAYKSLLDLRMVLLGIPLLIVCAGMVAFQWPYLGSTVPTPLPLLVCGFVVCPLNLTTMVLLEWWLERAQRRAAGGLSGPR
jgi:hypothetical protein